MNTTVINDIIKGIDRGLKLGLDQLYITDEF